MSGDQIIDPQRLRNLRRLKNIPQQKIAKAIGRSQAYVSCAERGTAELSLREQRIIAKVLGIAGGGV
jgi:transcriptional regulator with XRE-family HTH domain